MTASSSTTFSGRFMPYYNYHGEQEMNAIVHLLISMIPTDRKYNIFSDVLI